MVNMLTLDGEARERISNLKQYAEANKFSKEDLLAIIADPDNAAGNMKEFNCLLNDGYRVVYTIEEQPSFTCKHISISLNDNLPPVESSRLIIKEFGFENKMEDCYVYEEPNAINLLEKL